MLEIMVGGLLFLAAFKRTDRDPGTAKLYAAWR